MTIQITAAQETMYEVLSKNQNVFQQLIKLNLSCHSLQGSGFKTSFFIIFNSTNETRHLAERYRTQWSDGETHPVKVTGDMGQYLMTKAKEDGLGDFNKKDLIAATFAKKKDQGDFVYKG